MPKFKEESIKKIASKLKDERESEFVQNIKKLAQDEDGRKVLEAVLGSVEEDEIQKEAVPSFIKNVGKAVKNPGEAANKAYEALSSEGTGEALKNLGIATGAIGGGSYLGAHAYDQTFGQGAKPGNKRLQEILEVVPELKDKYTVPEIQRAWDTLREHGPRLANSDSVTAGKILERLLDYEGVDIQAIDQILDVERKKREARQDKMNPIKTGNANEGYLSSLPDKIQQADEENDIDKEAANEEFNDLKEIVSEYAD